MLKPSQKSSVVKIIICTLTYYTQQTHQAEQTKLKHEKRSRGNNQQIITYDRYEVNGFGSTPEDGIHNISFKGQPNHQLEYIYIPKLISSSSKPKESEWRIPKIDKIPERAGTWLAQEVINLTWFSSKLRL